MGGTFAVNVIGTYNNFGGNEVHIVGGTSFTIPYVSCIVVATPVVSTFSV